MEQNNRTETVQKLQGDLDVWFLHFQCKVMHKGMSTDLCIQRSRITSQEMAEEMDLVFEGHG